MYSSRFILLKGTHLQERSVHEGALGWEHHHWRPAKCFYTHINTIIYFLIFSPKIILHFNIFVRYLLEKIAHFGLYSYKKFIKFIKKN